MTTSPDRYLKSLPLLRYKTTEKKIFLLFFFVHYEPKQRDKSAPMYIKKAASTLLTAFFLSRLHLSVTPQPSIAAICRP